MNNIITFENFINEGLFSSKYKNIVDKIYNYIINNDINVKHRRHVDCFEFIIVMNNENDPFGEEDWEDDNDIKDINVKVMKDHGFMIDGYILLLNDIKVNVKSSEAGKIYKVLKNKMKNQEKIDKEKKLNVIFKKL